MYEDGIGLWEVKEQIEEQIGVRVDMHNKVRGVNAVVCDVASKPRGTIEWE
jgi:GMP synthase PP-ATPase subunit